MFFAPANAIYPGLGRFEVFDLAPDRLAALGLARGPGAEPFSVHAPLSRLHQDQDPSAVFFLAESPEREASFADLERTLAAAAARGAEHVVTHLNWTEDVGSERRAEALAWDAAARLCALGQRHRMPVHIECGGYSGGFHRAEQWARLARAFPDLGLCLDVGHLHLIAQVRGRPVFREIETLASHARSLHLWAARDLETYRQRGHVPLAPDLSPADGWLDLRRAVAPILEARPEAAVIFEYTWPAEETPRVARGLDWAREVVLEARHRAEREGPADAGRRSG